MLLRIATQTFPWCWLTLYGSISRCMFSSLYISWPVQGERICLNIKTCYSLPEFLRHLYVSSSNYFFWGDISNRWVSRRPFYYPVQRVQVWVLDITLVLDHSNEGYWALIFCFCCTGWLQSWALVSDHLGNSEKWSQLELVANENGLSKASTWNNRGRSLTMGLFTWREEDPRTRKILWEGKTTFCLVCMQWVCKVKGRTQVHSKCCVTYLELRHVCFSVHINSIFWVKVVYMVLGSS